MSERVIQGPGTGVLAIWHDIEPAREAEVIEWYNREHHAERVGIDGFRRSRRYVSVKGGPKYFIYYETDEAATLSSPPYLERANNPSEGSRRSIPFFRNNFRTVCRVAWRTSGPDGGHVATFRFGLAKADPDQVRLRLKEYFASEILPSPGLLKAQQWEADHSVTAIPTSDRALRPAADHHSEWVVVLSGIGPGVLVDIIERRLTEATWAKFGAAPGVAIGIYLLEAALEKEHIETQQAPMQQAPILGPGGGSTASI